jgi:hypothetical protein
MTDLMPASTIAELRQVLIDFEAQRPRSMQKELGPSGTATARRPRRRVPPDRGRL